MAGHREKRTKLWTSGVLSVYRAPLSIKCSRSVWGHSVDFRFLIGLHSRLASYMAGISGKRNLFLAYKWPSRVSRSLDLFFTHTLDYIRTHYNFRADIVKFSETGRAVIWHLHNANTATLPDYITKNRSQSLRTHASYKTRKKQAIDCEGKFF